VGRTSLDDQITTAAREYREALEAQLTVAVPYPGEYTTAVSCGPFMGSGPFMGIGTGLSYTGGLGAPMPAPPMVESQGGKVVGAEVGKKPYAILTESFISAHFFCEKIEDPMRLVSTPMGNFEECRAQDQKYFRIYNYQRMYWRKDGRAIDGRVKRDCYDDHAIARSRRARIIEWQGTRTTRNPRAMSFPWRT
jgi:hypothetical protein